MRAARGHDHVVGLAADAVPARQLRDKGLAQGDRAARVRIVGLAGARRGRQGVGDGRGGAEIGLAALEVDDALARLLAGARRGHHPAQLGGHAQNRSIGGQTAHRNEPRNLRRVGQTTRPRGPPGGPDWAFRRHAVCAPGSVVRRSAQGRLIMSKFDLRDISDRLARSKDTEAVVFEFLGYLQAVRPDWRAALAFYEVSHDALVNTYERQGSRLVRRDITIPVSQLPARLARKFFHPSAFFNHSDRRSLISQLFTGAPYYEPDPAEAASLRTVTPLPNWQSCVCLPLADQEDMLALLVVASMKQGAFGSKVVGEIIPVKSMAALALSQHLYRSTRGRETNGDAAVPQAAAADFHDRIHRLNTQTTELEEDNKAKARRLEALTKEIELLDKNSTQYKGELERVKGTLVALEEQSAAATEQLTDAHSQLTITRARAAEYQRTVSFTKEVAQVLAQEHRPSEFNGTLVSWFSEHFNVQRCSLMQLDSLRVTLLIP